MSARVVLALETSCDETSAAVLVDGVIRSNVVSSQVGLHAEYGGVVPELATREHLRNLLPVVRAALGEARVGTEDLTAIGVTRGPGLPAALMVGFQAAQAFGFVRGLPVHGVHHHEAHLYSPWIDGDPPRACWEEWSPNLSLVVSGGHTLLVEVAGEFDHRVLGSTLDDAAGECFDKIAKMLGLPYPGGPVLDRLAEEGDAGVFAFPRPLLNDPGDDFSFSGLKTSVRTFLERHPGLADDPVVLRDLCAGVRLAIVETLVTKTVRAARRVGVRTVTASGGVTANRGLRRQLASACAGAGLRLRMAAGAYCTDNAAMVGVVADRRVQLGHPAIPSDAETRPGWDLAEACQSLRPPGEAGADGGPAR